MKAALLGLVIVALAGGVLFAGWVAVRLLEAILGEIVKGRRR